MKNLNYPLVGIGFDVHRLTKNRKLVLGGIEIDSDVGLFGHSDADVLIHSIIDAILGAANLPDIGELFPDSEKKFKDISSVILLKKVLKKIYEMGFKVYNVDCIIIAQKPKISPYKMKIKKNLEKIINPIKWINIKATTTEKLGFLGREEGIAAQSIVSLIEIQK